MAKSFLICHIPLLSSEREFTLGGDKSNWPGRSSSNRSRWAPGKEPKQPPTHRKRGCVQLKAPWHFLRNIYLSHPCKCPRPGWMGLGQPIVPPGLRGIF
uniref:Uncharacterized protein n=1 Tax=Geospiza parvula TaxID=87175 RepID=A0A8C3QB34_GEOPR